MDRNERAQKQFLTYVKKEAVDMPDVGVVDIPEPKLYRDIFPWTSAPIMPIDNVEVPIDVPEKIWITDSGSAGRRRRSPCPSSSYTPSGTSTR
jgi:hypothetical protein